MSEDSPSTSPRLGLDPRWVSVLLPLAGIIIGAAVSYGIMSARVDGLEARLTRAEIAQEARLLRIEDSNQRVRSDVAGAREALAGLKGLLKARKE